MPFCSRPDPHPPYPPQALGPTLLQRTFSAAFGDDYAALRAAERWLKARGFSVGRLQAPAPSGILFGAFDVQKWRNLSDADRRALHGKLSGDFRDGPVTVELFATAPAEAIAAFQRETADA